MEAIGTNQYNDSLKQVSIETVDIIWTELISLFRQKKYLLKAVSTLEELDYDNTHYLSSLGSVLPATEDLSVFKSYLAKFENYKIFQKFCDEKIKFEGIPKLLAISRTLASVQLYVNRHFIFLPE